eukprot:TRINITY_DN8348_c0_g4_i1.p1 TRINITY_DN8348_c0_g4~~TRINITY_DN8348_c0_g4_i1.p1  ORF type:complete len:341 (-),score=33.40 TRINITY_DN8348_c0_g4_i1:216-1238(-)
MDIDYRRRYEILWLALYIAQFSIGVLTLAYVRYDQWRTRISISTGTSTSTGEGPRGYNALRRSLLSTASMSGRASVMDGESPKDSRLNTIYWILLFSAFRTAEFILRLCTDLWVPEDDDRAYESQARGVRTLKGFFYAFPLVCEVFVFNSMVVSLTKVLVFVQDPLNYSGDADILVFVRRCCRVVNACFIFLGVCLPFLTEIFPSVEITIVTSGYCVVALATMAMTVFSLILSNKMLKTANEVPEGLSTCRRVVHEFVYVLWVFSCLALVYGGLSIYEGIRTLNLDKDVQIYSYPTYKDIWISHTFRSLEYFPIQVLLVILVRKHLSIAEESYRRAQLRY